MVHPDLSAVLRLDLNALTAIGRPLPADRIRWLQRLGTASDRDPARTGPNKIGIPRTFP